MPIAILLVAFLAACAPATAASVHDRAGPTDPAAFAALARDTAIELGLAIPAMRDDLELVFEPKPIAPATLTIVRVTNIDHHTSLRIVFTDDAAGPRAIAAWPL